MKELNIKLFYLSCHNLLKKRYGIGKYIKRKELHSELGRHFLVPKNLRDVAIKELENMGLVKRENRDTIKILNYKLDIEEDANRFFKKVGLF